MRPLAESIERTIQPDGSLADNASPELGRIRREQERQKKLIEESLRATLRKLASEGATQEELITIRGDRFVIPVRSELKRRVSGVVHGVSSSGQTVYLEPLETIEQNNELVRLIEEEQAEIHRIFMALTRQVGGYAHALVEGARVLALVDSLQARARFARDYNCVAPAITPDLLHLEAARHPLLERHLRQTGGHVVPLTLELTASERQLIISGPNTGGKTVTLKTTALLAMMAQAGLPIPASAASFPVFTAFLADIGDAQSIEAELSTFSAHITNLDRLSRLAGDKSLVLLDELGSSTDPEEGSALAVAIASHFLTAGAWTLISTHHTSLKVYAANTPGVLNAAAGVDEVTLVPNYQLRLGVPGASAGIQTAERLGLNAAIIAAARQRLGSQQVDIARFLDKLHSELTQLEADRKAARVEQYALNQERARLAREGDVELRNRTRELETKLASLLKDFEFQMRETVRAIEDRAGQAKTFQGSRAPHPAPAPRVSGELQPDRRRPPHRRGCRRRRRPAAHPQAHRRRRPGSHQVDEQDCRRRSARSRKTSLKLPSAPSKCASSATSAAQPQPSERLRDSRSALIRSPPPASRRTFTSPSPAPTPTPCARRSTSSAAPWTRPRRSWRHILTAPSSPACRASASSTATAPASSAAASANSSRPIPT